MLYIVLSFIYIFAIPINELMKIENTTAQMRKGILEYCILSILKNEALLSEVKVLNSKEIVRVSDITPLRAISQEIISNRVVYGGYLDKGTEPSSIKYNASIENKSEQVVVSSGSSNILNFMNTDYRKEYQNHNLKLIS